MIVVRAPLRISFVGGGTDLPDFYHRRPGRVISTAIDKFVYVVVNRTPMIDKVTARYSITESVDQLEDLKHTRIKAALSNLNIKKNIEISSFASMPAKTGFGSSSSFSVALIKVLNAFQGIKIDQREAAEAASHLEINLLGEPIGKQDQYAASFGGFNILQFNPDESVDVSPLLIDYKKRLLLEDSLLIFYTGITRDASSVLTEQKANTNDNFQTLSEMADSVSDFADRIISGDIRGLGAMLHQGWLKKKSLASNVSNSTIDDLYNAGVSAGAWGGKILGAGGGGCVLFICPLDKKNAILESVKKVATEKSLNEFREIPVKFVQSGAEILYNGDHYHKNFV
ncbi:MAG: GHMP kinase [Candidatus Liptonbacteria bacterium]|nr:GHMP kinase [Candidatus Liptonbacteria bacterium]